MKGPQVGVRALGLDPRTLGLAAALAAIWVGLHLASGGLFLTPRNLYNLAVQSSVVGIMASGMVLVISARHIDLSVGSVLGFTGMCVALLQAEGMGQVGPVAWPVAAAAGIAIGTLVGAWQGWLVAYLRVPAFVVTLAGLLVFRGAAYLVAEGRTVTPLAEGYGVMGGGIEGALGETASWGLAGLFAAAVATVGIRGRARRRRNGFAPRPLRADAMRIAAAAALGFGFVAVMNAHPLPGSQVGRGVPIPVLAWIGSALVVSVLYRATRFGRWVLAIGGNPAAAVRAGIRVRHVSIGVFALMGTLAGLASVVTTARLGAGTNSMGTLAELSVIAAAVIGGTSLAGGRGSIVGAALGAVLMQSLENGMVLLGVSSAMRQIAIGVALVVAVWIDVATRSRSANG